MSPLLVEDGGGSVSISDGALARVVSQAVESVAGARLHHKPDLELARGKARASLALRVAYGEVLPEVARSVQQRVADALAAMCAVEVAAVDVTVEELAR